MAYRPYKDNQTRFDQSAEFDCRGLTHNENQAFGLFASAARKVEEACQSRFAENAARGRSGFAHILETLYGSKIPAGPTAFQPHVLC